MASFVIIISQKRNLHNVNIGLEGQYFPYFLAGGGVPGIDFFLLGQQRFTLGLERFDGGQLLYPQGVKGRLRRFMQKNVASAGIVELFAVLGLAVGGINLAGFGVIDDVGF